MEILAAIAGFVVLVGLLAWAYAQSAASEARAEERRKTLQSGAEVRNEVDEKLAEPVPTGSSLWDRWDRLRNRSR